MGCGVRQFCFGVYISLDGNELTLILLCQQNFVKFCCFCVQFSSCLCTFRSTKFCEILVLTWARTNFVQFCSQAAARKSTRGGTSGSNRGPAARTKGTTQAHEGRNRWFQQRPRNKDQGASAHCENFTKASGTDEIAKKSPAATGRRRFVSGRRPRFCIGSILQKWIPKFQNFKISKLKFWKIQTTLAHLFWITGNDTIKRKF